MASLKKTVLILLALDLSAATLPASVPSSEEATLAKRDPFEIVVYPDGACQQGVSAQKTNLEPSGCWNFGTSGGNYGAFLLNIFEVS